MERRLATCLTLVATLAASGCGGGTAAPAENSGAAGSSATQGAALSASAVSATLVALDWSSSTVSGHAYKIYRNGRLDKSAKLAGAGAIDSDLKPGTQYCYRLVAGSGGADTADGDQSCVTTPALAGWEIQTISLPPPMTMALDSHGQERFGYCGPWSVIYLEHGSDDAWTSSGVDTSATCFDAPLAVDQAGAAHMVYLDEQTNTLRYATDASGTWQVAEIPGTEGAEFYVMALDGAGHLHIAYQLFTSQAPDYFQVVYATDASGSWQSTVVARGDVYPVIAVDGAGMAHIAFLGAQAPDGSYPVHYLTDASGIWTDVVVATSSDAKSLLSLAVDAVGNVDLAYKSHTGLYYASDLSGSWQTSQVDSFGDYGPKLDSYGVYDVSLALDASGAAHISYEDTSGNLKYASPKGQGWDTLYLDTVGTQNKLCLDAAGHAHIVYGGVDNQTSKLAVSP